MRRDSIRFCVVFGLLVFLPACSSQSTPEETAIAPLVSTESERGPVRVIVTASPSRVTVGETITLTIEVLAESEVQITMPSIEETFGVFEVGDADLPPDLPEGERRRWRHTYSLSTFDDGDLELPAMTVRFIDQRDPDPSNVITGEIVTEPLIVYVESLLAGEVEQERLHDIKAAVEVPVSRMEPWVVAVVTIFAIVIAVMLAMILTTRRRRALQGQAHFPPHTWALLQLERLEHAHLVERQEFHAFYFQLSDIVRQYIELRFGLKAPERTTEEFLREMQREKVLTIGHKELLSSFLRAADMVKFAKHRPESRDCQEAFDSASFFVKETTPTPEEIEQLPAVKEAAA